jgi:hypothetical protein
MTCFPLSLPTPPPLFFSTSCTNAYNRSSTSRDGTCARRCPFRTKGRPRRTWSFCRQSLGHNSAMASVTFLEASLSLFAASSSSSRSFSRRRHPRESKCPRQGFRYSGPSGAHVLRHTDECGRGVNVTAWLVRVTVTFGPPPPLKKQNFLSTSSAQLNSGGSTSRRRMPSLMSAQDFIRRPSRSSTSSPFRNIEPSL